MALPTTETTLYLKRMVSAPRAKVFKAWTNPAELKKWFAINADYETPIAEVDLRVGGKYRIGMKPKAKDAVHVATGVYREIRPPEKLVFTWSWEGEAEKIDTLVTVEFRDMGSSTEIILKHEFFPDGPTRDKHMEGWTGCLNMLAEQLHVPSHNS